MIRVDHLLATSKVIIALFVLSLLILPSEATLSCNSAYTQIQPFNNTGEDVNVLSLTNCDYFPLNVTVLVYDRDSDMQPDTADWTTNADFDSDLYLFDVRSDGVFDVAFDFSRADGQYIAEIYDSHREGFLELGNTRGIPQVDGRWTVRLESEEPWVTDGRPAAEMRVLVDGPVQAKHGNIFYLADLAVDSVIDFETEVIDADNDGYPDHQMTQIYVPDDRESLGVVRTWVIRNLFDRPIGADGWHWPFVGVGHVDWIRNAFEPHPAPIRIDWRTGRVVTVTQFVPSHMGDNTYYIQSIAPFGREEGQIYANFENPYGFYDLAGDNDGQAELVLRFQSRGADDPFGSSPRIGNDIAQINIRYTWTQTNPEDLNWDYSLTLFGFHAVDERFTVPEVGVEVDTVLYENMPYWVTERDWEVANLITVESDGYQSNEGLYEGAIRAVATGVTRDYVFGASREPAPDPFEHSLRIGFRNEYSLQLMERPLMYFSPVDQRLHMKNPQHGFWQVDDTNRILYDNFEGNAYFDRWQHVLVPVKPSELPRLHEPIDPNAEPVLQQELVHWGGLAIYHDTESQVMFKYTDTAPALFETLPPRNAREWGDLNEQLAPYRPRPDGLDFGAAFGRLAGEANTLNKARIEDLRYHEGGLRFVLHLQEDFVAEGARIIDNRIAPGSYDVRYVPGEGFRLQLSTPATITLNSPDPQAFSSIQQNVIHLLDFSITNEGTYPAEDITLEVYDGSDQVYRRESIRVSGGESMTFTTEWIPQQTGPTQVRAVVRDVAAGMILNEAVLDFDVVPASTLELSDRLTALGTMPLLPLGVIFFAILILVSSVLVLILIEFTSTEDSASS